MKKFFTLGLLSISLTVSAQVPGYVPTGNLLGWYPMTGNTNDLSGGGNHMTAFNGAVLAPDRFSNANCAYYLDGVDDWLNTDTAILNASLPHSISMWWATTDSAKTNQTLFNTNPHTLENFAFNFTSTPPDPNPYGLDYGMGDGIPGSWTILHPDTGQINIAGNFTNWHHVVWVRNNINWKIYYDAMLVDSFSSGLNCGSMLADLRFGAENNGVTGALFEGHMDDIGIWDRALSQAEVIDLFVGGNVGINEQSIETISIYPNPFSSTIYFNDTKVIGMNYYIFNSQGNQIQSGILSNNQLDLSRLQNGIYFIRVGNSTKLNKKIIKQ